MGRRRKGPVQLNGGDTWYVRLWVPAKDRQRAGKTTLIRSLGTTNHSTALKRYGAAYMGLERELEVLLGSPDYRDRVEAGHEAESRPGDASLTSQELTELQLGSFDPSDQTHQAVFDYYESGTPLPITWDEARELWIKERNRIAARPLSEKSIKAMDRVIKTFDIQPHQITKQEVRKWLSRREQHKKPISVHADYKMIKSFFNVLVKYDHVETNVFTSVGYSVSENIMSDDKRRAFTDDEICTLKDKCLPVFWMVLTGLRPGELASRLQQDIDGNMLVINEQPSLDWRPKTLSSYRRVPMPKGLVIDTTKTMKTKEVYWRRTVNDLFGKDTNVSPHSARHTFYSLTRRAGCNTAVAEALAGHASSAGSTTAKAYGDYADSVLIEEISKVWKLVETITDNAL